MRDTSPAAPRPAALGRATSVALLVSFASMGAAIAGGAGAAPVPTTGAEAYAEGGTE